MARTSVGITAIALATASLLAFGVLGIGRSNAINLDMNFLYAAGRMWLAARSPYVLADYRHDGALHPELSQERIQLGFAYPPTAGPLCILLGAGSFGLANVIMVALNLAATAAAAYYAYRIVCARMPEGTLRSSLKWTVPALVIGNPFTTHIMHGGQTTMIVTAALLAAWFYSQVERRPVVSGVLLALATMKPQVVLLVMVWIALERNWKQLAACAVTGLLLVAWPMIVSGGPVQLLHQWVQALHDYETGPIQVVGFQAVFGIESLLTASGVRTPKLWFVGFALAVLMWRFRRRFSQDAIVAILVGAACLFVYAHDYDLAVLAPLFALVWRVSAGNNLQAAAAAAFYALMFGPQRFVRSSHMPLLVHWRELVLLAGIGALLWLVEAEGRRSAISSVPPAPVTEPKLQPSAK